MPHDRYHERYSSLFNDACTKSSRHFLICKSNQPPCFHMHALMQAQLMSLTSARRIIGPFFRRDRWFCCVASQSDRALSRAVCPRYHVYIAINILGTNIIFHDCWQSIQIAQDIGHHRCCLRLPQRCERYRQGRASRFQTFQNLSNHVSLGFLKLEASCTQFTTDHP